jgi:trk system potassium uptake protein TrkA
MKIVVVGAGEVGFYLCQVLSDTGHDVTLIESSASRANEVDEVLNVRVVTGNGASAEGLSRAGVIICW